MPWNKSPEKNVTFIRLADKSPADGCDEAVEPATAAKKTATAKAATPVKNETGGFNLDDILG